MHLLNHFEKKEKENRLLDLVDNQIQDMRFNRAEMMTIMRVAAWCLLSDYAKRPSMSMVVNFLEDDVEFEGNLDNSSSNPALETKSEEVTTLAPSMCQYFLFFARINEIWFLCCFSISMDNIYNLSFLGKRKLQLHYCS